jgi:D-sedoheptulose 7-phosphate isomerase
MDKISELIKASIQVKERLLSDKDLVQKINQCVDVFVNCFANGGKVLLCGNGGSAADAQHIAAELSGRFYIDRTPLFAEALHVNTSYLTAVANDYGFNAAFARLVEGMGKKGDILLALSTSGNSENIVNAVAKANEAGITTISLTGESGGKLKSISSILINVPSADTPRIQETHILIGHIICQLVEAAIFSK